NFNYQGKGMYPSRRIPRDGVSRGKIKHIHKLVMTDLFGFQNVPEGFHIHHRDGDGRHNTPENLALLSIADHRWLHWQFGLAILQAISNQAITIAEVSPR